MKKSILHFAIIMCILSYSYIQAQISPGDLTMAHAELEGISNCTLCHALGKKISDEKCLACHEEIKVRMDDRKGFHASNEVRGKECATCHSEHHGRKFKMIRFDEENFNHNLTGYELTGAHQKIDCRQCHIPDFINEPDLKKRNETYLGLQQGCVSCHEDIHQNTLSTNNCANCHITDAFSPAEKFDHDNAKFLLLGKHKTVECIDCHLMEQRNGKEFQVFAGVEFANCNSCHDDLHDNNLGTNCKQCHIEESFTSLIRVKRYNHNQTEFPLKGAHKRIDCASCHNLESPPKDIFQDKIGIQTNECNSCHEDVHDNKFGSNCVDCHNEESFQQVNMDNFNHAWTNFQLKGKHNTVDCRKCHISSFTSPLLHNTCAACHVDYHEGEFADNGLIPDCAKCHTEEGFDLTLYSIEEHNQSQFPLEGGHLATPCFACHLQEDKWRFKNIGERCVDCHDDIHRGFIDEKYYPNQTCEKCHVTENWVENSFDHNLTAFKLEGKHTKLTCMDCHAMDEALRTNKYEGFSNIVAECASCHENTHEQQFEENGLTDCARCHGFEDWKMDDFDHDKTAFKLEGKHAKIECSACHKPLEVDGKIFIKYKFENFECVACH